MYAITKKNDSAAIRASVREDGYTRVMIIFGADEWHISAADSFITSRNPERDALRHVAIKLMGAHERGDINRKNFEDAKRLVLWLDAKIERDGGIF